MTRSLSYIGIEIGIVLTFFIVGDRCELVNSMKKKKKTCAKCVLKYELHLQ